ncbi:hypothetical protein QO004_005047 [Rhizobium mesoamericanum]|uniref:hypothetical protein n=1 Tax=Rhizobium mesoamericanum TaxID=1079800 RepID=UPI00278A0DC1|nr:hypothetical protein [Rhizobium mesoamericanum]MDQ0563238.1 hypothetical protein [Rhizobium mesoamericanum]
MSDSVVNVWPEDIPISLWSYHLLRPEQRDLLPFMGVRLEWNFIFAFLFGAALIAVFAWQRFRQPSSQPGEYDYEVLKKLAPTQLRDGNAMRQAYCYYAGILVAIYAALTFFGGLIFKTVSYIPMAGLEVDVGRDTLTSPSWPLTLAIGMAGFAPLLKPVGVGETWLRRLVHGWAGVPMQLKERTRRLLLTLDQHIRPIVEKATSKNNAEATIPTSRSLDIRRKAGRPDDTEMMKERDDPLFKFVLAKLEYVKPWMAILLERTGNLTPLVRKWVELEIMTEAIRDPGSWPDTLVLDELQQIARDQREAAESTLRALEDLSKSSYPVETKDAAAAVGADEEADREARARQRRQLETMLEDTLTKVDKSRLELAAILAVYAERSPYLEETSSNGSQRRAEAGELDRTLKAAVKAVTPPQRGPETGFWILILLPVVFCTYALMTRLGLHSPLTDVELTAMTIFVTAALETLQVAAIFWMPVLAVMALQQYLTEADRRRHLGDLNTSRQSTERMIWYIAIALLVAAIGLTLVAMFWMALIAENPDRFRDLLYGRKRSAFATMIPKSVCAGIFAFSVVWASEHRAQKKRTAIIYGIMAALTMVALVMGISLTWQSGCLTETVCTPWKTLGKAFLQSGWPVFNRFYRFYNLTDLVVCFAVVVVAVTNAAWPRRPDTDRPRTRVRLGLGRSFNYVPILGIFAVSLTLSGTAFADPPDEKAGDSPWVSAGFRRDAEPFSYLAGPLDTQRFRGYAADLCYSIFADSPYGLHEVEVTAADRFDSFRTGREHVQKPIDILCDPTTLRYWRNDEVIDGYFSPIVFVTGVSYLARRVFDPHAGIDLAYVENTTAEQVAMRACAVDFFGVASSTQNPKNCIWSFRDCPLGKEASKDMPSARLCSFPNYDALTEWFCKKGQERQKVYFGDREIIQAKFTSWLTVGDCTEQDVERFASFYTYEPYGLLVSRDRPELARFVQRRVYDFFSHRTKAISLFTTYFPGVQMSPMMANLILLNGIDEPMYETVPSYLFAEKGHVKASNCRGDDPCR